MIRIIAVSGALILGVARNLSLRVQLFSLCKKVLKIVVTGLTIVGVIIVGVNVFAGVLLGNCEFSEFFGPYFPFLISVITSSNLSLLFMSAPLISNISKPNPEDKSILNPDFITGLTEAFKNKDLVVWGKILPSSVGKAKLTKVRKRNDKIASIST